MNFTTCYNDFLNYNNCTLCHPGQFVYGYNVNFTCLDCDPRSFSNGWFCKRCYLPEKVNKKKNACQVPYFNVCHEECDEAGRCYSYSCYTRDGWTIFSSCDLIFLPMILMFTPMLLILLPIITCWFCVPKVSSPDFRVIDVEVLKSYGRIPKNQDLLEEYLEYPANYTFIQHRWETLEDPDPDNKTYNWITQNIKGKIFIDYACIPQKPRNEIEYKKFVYLLNHLDSIILKARSFESKLGIFEGNDRLWILYERKVMSYSTIIKLLYKMIIITPLFYITIHQDRPFCDVHMLWLGSIMIAFAFPSNLFNVLGANWNFKYSLFLFYNLEGKKCADESDRPEVINKFKSMKFGLPKGSQIMGLIQLVIYIVSFVLVHMVELYDYNVLIMIVSVVIISII